MEQLGAGVSDPIPAIDEILGDRAARRRAAAEADRARERRRELFVSDFEDAVDDVIRPAMEAVIRRLRADGGGGAVIVDPPNVRGRRRVVLWMSLDGPLVGEPRQDHNPFLQMDADPVHERVDLWEGDLVHREGVSRATGSWTLDQITAESVESRAVGILRRARSHGLAG